MKSIKVIFAFGGIAIFLLLLFSLFALQSSPSVTKYSSYTDQLKLIHNLEMVAISKKIEKNGNVYSMRIVPKRKMLAPAIDELMNDVGRYMWRNHPFGEKPAQVIVFCQIKEDSGCQQNQETKQKNVLPPVGLGFPSVKPTKNNDKSK